MNFNRNILWVLIASAVLAACSSTVTSVDDEGGNVYALPLAVVDQMLQDAMATSAMAISAAPTSRIESPAFRCIGEMVARRNKRL